jgi:uncharacterized protein YndB with AHSA1/START domain
MTGAGGVDFAIFRILDAPRERVWQALTEPERLKEWLAPATFTMIAMNMDFRPGGFAHWGIQSGEGYKMWAKYVYQEIIPPERIVFINSFSNQAGARSACGVSWRSHTMLSRSARCTAGADRRMRSPSRPLGLHSLRLCRVEKITNRPHTIRCAERHH